jgi:hypothetical protein
MDQATLDRLTAAVTQLATVVGGLKVDTPSPPITQPPAPGKKVDWAKTGAAVEAYAKATGKWVEIRIYTDGTREGPELPTPPATTPPTTTPPVTTPPANHPPTTTPPVTTPPAAGNVVWSGMDKLNHRYGHTWDHDGMLTVSSWAGDGFKPSGAMQPPKQGGNGYGIYTIEIDAAKGNAPGIFCCLWPENDVWAWEVDIVEKDFNGNGVFTVHWGGNTPAGDKSKGYPIPGIRPEDRHTYELTWARDLLVLKVDGVEKVRTTQNVPRDASDGGVNALLGAGTQPAWAAQAQNGDCVLNVYACSYRKLGGL